MTAANKKERIAPLRVVLMFLWLLIKSWFGYWRKMKEPKKDSLHIDQKELRVWMIGHATVLINFYGTVILTDPAFTSFLPPKRLVKAGYTIEELPDIDILLITHAHLDHWQPRDVEKLKHKVKNIIFPSNCSDRLPKRHSMRTHELGWETQLRIGSVHMQTFKPKHWGELTPWSDKDRGYNSYLLEKGGVKVFVCGDSAWCDMFSKIGALHDDIEIAFLPIGAYAPREQLNGVHMSPEQAIDAFLALGAKKLIPYHYDTFMLAWEPVGEAPEILRSVAAEKGVSDRVHFLEAGEGLVLTS